jgi:hypothetical protein
MNGLLPSGFIALREATAMIESALMAGRSEEPRVTKLRRTGLDVAHQDIRRAAAEELWKAVDRGALQVFAIGGKRRRLFRVTASFSSRVPLLRNPRVLALHYLRPGDPLHTELTARFGANLGQIVLMVREKDIKRVIGNVLRRRREPASTKQGRPSFNGMVVPIIRDLVDKKKWSILQPLKLLTTLVNRKVPRLVSEDTVTRALDRLYEETKDPKFQRVRRRRA